ncbi:MAG: N-acetylmuramoyl-L-alanine amidase [Firmicutes bacterium]|nr:N-acetylmuramoyl-L-alanine amidase [Bacillota bacterium]
MSNSSLVEYTKISPNKNSPRNAKIDTISIHCAAGVLSIESFAGWFAQTVAQSSCQYIVGGDGRVALVVDERDRSWCTSSPINDHKAVTIEIVNSKAAYPWPITDIALEKTIQLCTDIAKRNNIPKINYTGDKTGNLTMHRWFSNKECPGDYLAERFPMIANEVNRRLTQQIIAKPLIPESVPVKPSFPLLEQNIQAMVSLDICKSPEYWLAKDNLQWLNELLYNIANSEKFCKSQYNDIKTVDTALDVLNSVGVMASPLYWRTLIDNGIEQYLGNLIINMANKAIIKAVD